MYMFSRAVAARGLNISCNPKEFTYRSLLGAGMQYQATRFLRPLGPALCCGFFPSFSGFFWRFSAFSRRFSTGRAWGRASLMIRHQTSFLADFAIPKKRKTYPESTWDGIRYALLCSATRQGAGRRPIFSDFLLYQHEGGILLLCGPTLPVRSSP